MARTAQGAALTQQHRGGQLAIRAGLLRDLTRLWPLFDPTDFDSFERFSAVAAILVRARHRDSAGLASGYFAAFRLLEGVAGEIMPQVPEPPPERVTRDALRSTGLLGVLNARRAGLPLEAAARNGFVRIAGSATSLVLRGGRDTILDGVARDRHATRWQRVTASQPCAFCRMLASRGAVFRSDSSADFQAHSHCVCMAEPAYQGSALPAASESFRRQWEESTAGLSGDDALVAFRRFVEGRG